MEQYANNLEVSLTFFADRDGESESMLIRVWWKSVQVIT